MASGPLFYVDVEDESNNYKYQRLPVVHIYEDGERLEIVLSTRELKTIKKSEVKGVRWD